MIRRLGAAVIAAPLPWVEIAGVVADADAGSRDPGFDTIFDEPAQAVGPVEDHNRPTTDLVLPKLDAYNIGALLQILMLATVTEAPEPLRLPSI